MIPKALAQIDLEDLRQLIEGEVREGRTIEYKQEFPTGAEQDKVHFLRAIASLANTNGGDIIYGMKADSGLPIEVCGFTMQESYDEVQLKFDAWLRDGIQPRVQGVDYNWIDVAADKVALVVRVRASWNPPHRLNLKSNQHFYGRNSAGAYPLDVSELRAAFALSDSVAKNAAAFRAERLMRVEAHYIPVPMERHGMAVVHVLPVSAFSGADSLRIQATKDLARKFRLVAGAGHCPDVNLDGAVHFERRGAPNHQYTQAFRNGCLEMVTTLPPYGQGSGPRISGHWLVKNIIESLDANLRALRSLGFDGPLIISLALVSIGGYALETHDEVTKPIESGLKRILLPDVLVEESGWAAKAGMRDTFDVMWNAFGFEHCTAYDHDGSLVRT